MFKKGFVFPGLRHDGFEAGFALQLIPELRDCPDLRVELILFRHGLRHGSVFLTPPAAPALYFQSWESEWGFDQAEANATDLYCLRVESPSQPDRVLPSGGLEGQMLFRHTLHGWTSTVLTGFIPLRPPGHRYGPIYHTAHCMANPADTETIHLFLNLRDVLATEAAPGGHLRAQLYRRDSTLLGHATYPVLSNASVAISHDQVARDCGITPAELQQGVNIKFHGGASQFAILTLLRHREKGSIALEHTLPPIYYIPALPDPAVRNLVYRQFEAKA